MRIRKGWAFLTALVVVQVVAGQAIGQDRRAIGPEAGRFSDPMYGVHTWQQQPMNGRNAMFLFLSAQRRAAQDAAAREAAENQPTGTATRAMPYHQSRPGGDAAASYFGRTTVRTPAGAPAPPARYNRYQHYFGNPGG